MFSEIYCEQNLTIMPKLMRTTNKGFLRAIGNAKILPPVFPNSNLPCEEVKVHYKNN